MDGSIYGMSQFMNVGIPRPMICVHKHRDHRLEGPIGSFRRIHPRAISWRGRMLDFILLQHPKEVLVYELAAPVGQYIIWSIPAE